MSQINWKSPRTLATIAALVVVSLVALSIGLAPEPAPPPAPTPILPTSTPAPTQIPPPTPTLDPSVCQTYTEVMGDGGPVVNTNKSFLEMIEKPPYCLRVTFNDLKTSEMVTEEVDPTAKGFSFFGSAAQAKEFKALHPNVRILKETVAFVSPLGLWSNPDHTQAFVDAGFVIPLDDINSFVMPTDKFLTLLEAREKGLNYTDLGINITHPATGEPLPVFTKAPDFGASSSFALSALYANCWISQRDDTSPCFNAATQGDLAYVMPKLKDYWQANGGQNSGSLGSFELYINAGRGMPLHANYSGALHSYCGRSGLSQDECLTLSKKLVFIHLETTIINQHTAYAYNDAGVKYLEALASIEAKRIFWLELGMPSGAMALLGPNFIEYLNYQDSISANEPSQAWYNDMNACITGKPECPVP